MNDEASDGDLHGGRAHMRWAVPDIALLAGMLVAAVSSEGWL
jgi:hypothetical protein